eukprot:Nitzschia sp. Nitz4//scaffold22_size323478//22591//25338//NITZ4_000495-RA/size323478-processed-gene-0.381-mRNA-1//1//CDS//3329542899//2669//frame0
MYTPAQESTVTKPTTTVPPPPFDHSNHHHHHHHPHAYYDPYRYMPSHAPTQEVATTATTYNARDESGEPADGVSLVAHHHHHDSSRPLHRQHPNNGDDTSFADASTLTGNTNYHPPLDTLVDPPPHHHHHHHHHHDSEENNIRGLRPPRAHKKPVFHPNAAAAATAGHATMNMAPTTTTANHPSQRYPAHRPPPPPPHHQHQHPTTTLPSDAARTGPGGDATYVLTIHEMLEDADAEHHTHIVSWQPHGRAFKIHNEELFVRDVMPRYFKAKIGSFRRWLRAWGFVRMTEGKDRGAWYHRYFVRGVTTLCRNMTRQQMAQAMVNWPPAGQVPDFYSAASGSTLSEKVQEGHGGQRIKESVGQGGAVATAGALHNGEAVGGALPPAAAPTAPDATTLPLAKNPKRLRGTVLEDLRQMLEDAETEGRTDIVSWMPHGRAFKIHNKTQFQNMLMPRYFKTAKATHLSDTLRIWGFQRLKKPGKDKGCYYHKYFVRGNPSLSRHLTRVQMRDSMSPWPPQEGEPDLYQPMPVPVAPPVVVATNPETGDDTAGAGNGGSVPMAGSDLKENGELSQSLEADNLGLQQGQAMEEWQDEGPGANRSDGTYALRLHEMLEDAEKEGHQHIVSWQPHGRAFRIHREKEFAEQVMPRYFKAKMGSFLRWCRAWGFVRMTEGRDRGAWYHRYFIRGVTSLSRSMTRQQMLKAMEDWLPAGHVPNFYESGVGEILSETRPIPIVPPSSVTCKNPKRLRGTVPEDLRQMLDDAEREGKGRVVSWLAHGLAFKIHDKKTFARDILPRYFRASKYTYFSDALRIWGWQRLKNGRDKGAYFHRLFVKGQPQLTRHLTRIQMKGSMCPWPPANGEPNLYEAPPEVSIDLIPMPVAPLQDDMGLEEERTSNHPATDSPEVEDGDEEAPGWEVRM